EFYVREDFVYILLRDLAKRDRRFRRYFRSLPVYNNLGYPFGNRLDFDRAFKACDLLDATASRKKVKLTPLATSHEIAGPGAYFSPSGADKPPHPALQGCIACHDSERARLHGRPIPFAHPRLLEAALGSEAASSRRTLRDEILYRIRAEGLERMPPPFA